MNTFKIFILVYLWSYFDALIISTYLVPILLKNSIGIFDKGYLNHFVLFTTITLTIPFVFWIQVPISILCCFKDRVKIKHK